MNMDHDKANNLNIFIERFINVDVSELFICVNVCGVLLID